MSDPSQLWRELHEYAPLNRQGWTFAIARRWFYFEWMPKVDQLDLTTNCGCSHKFRVLIASWGNLPSFNSPDEFSRWTWKIHYLVNADLGKPKFSWIEFLNLYGGAM